MKSHDHFSSSMDQMERTCWYTLQSLCLMGYREPDQFTSRFREAMEDVALGQFLLRRGVLDREALLNAIEESLASGRLLGYVLIREGVCSFPEMVHILAERYARVQADVEGAHVPGEGFAADEVDAGGCDRFDVSSFDVAGSIRFGASGDETDRFDHLFEGLVVEPDD